MWCLIVTAVAVGARTVACVMATVLAAAGHDGRYSAGESIQCGHALVLLVLRPPFDASHLAVVLFKKQFGRGVPRFVGIVVIIVNKLGLKEPTLGHLSNKEYCLGGLVNKDAVINNF